MACGPEGPHPSTRTTEVVESVPLPPGKGMPPASFYGAACFGELFPRLQGITGRVSPKGTQWLIVITVAKGPSLLQRFLRTCKDPNKTPGMW